MIADPTAEPIEAIAVETRSDNPIITALAWAGVVLVIGVLSWWVWTRWISPPVGGVIQQYVDGGGVLFESPPDQFRVTMPTQYSRRTGPHPLGTIVIVSDRPGGGYQFSATKTPQPESSLENYETTLDQVARGLVRGKKAEIVSESEPLPFVDIGLKEIAYRRDGTYWRARLYLLSDRIYTVIAQAPNDDDAPFKRLVGSFQILGPH